MNPIPTLALTLFFALPALPNQTLAKLPADSWYTVPNSKMRSFCDPHSGSYGCGAVQLAWSGGAYDGDEKKMLIWGGGHVDSDDNAVYAFGTEEWRWERLTNNTGYLTPQSSVDPLSNGDPASRHTYNGLAYASHLKRMWACQGSVAGNGNGTHVVWTFDAAQKKWFNMNATGTAGGSYFGYNDGCAYDPVTRRVFFSDPRNLAIYNFDSNAWINHGWAKEDWGKKTGVYDPKRRLIFFFGVRTNIWDLQNNKEITTGWGTSDSATLLNGSATAFDYDLKSDQIVAWIGGGPYALNMTTKQWVRKSGTGAPAAPLQNGTFGRWRYIPSDNVFILVNGVDSDVYFYKHTAGGGAGTGVEEKRTSENGKGQVAVSPNPFHKGTTIRFTGPAPGTLALFDLTGRRVAQIPVTDGKASVNGRDARGRALTPGVYTAIFRMGGRVYSQQLFLVQ